MSTDWTGQCVDSSLRARIALGRIMAKIDDDMLKHYCNEDLFIMEITTSTEDGMYDITLKELFDT